MPLDKLSKLLVRRLLPNPVLPLLENSFDRTLVLLRLAIERVDDVPEKVERGGPGSAEEVLVPLVGFEERVDRLPRRVGGDVTGGLEFGEQVLPVLRDRSATKKEQGQDGTYDKVLACLPCSSTLLLCRSLPNIVGVLLRLADFLLKDGEDIHGLNLLQLRVVLPFGRAEDGRLSLLPANAAGEVERERLEDRRDLLHVLLAHDALLGL